MEIVDVSVEYPSGLTITDRATLVADLDQVCISERLALVIQRLSETEPPPRISARCVDGSLQLEARIDGTCQVVSKAFERSDRSGLLRRLADLVRSPTKDQRQQFGRFMHTLAAAALIGAIGLWHSTSNWSAPNVLSEINLIVAFVITFYVGMVSMNGE